MERERDTVFDWLIDWQVQWRRTNLGRSWWMLIGFNDMTTRDVEVNLLDKISVGNTPATFWFHKFNVSTFFIFILTYFI